MKDVKKIKFVSNVLMSCAFATSVLAAGVGVAALNDTSVVNANAETTHTEAIFMANGASIRYSDPSGIRFIGYVKDDGDLSDNVVGMTVTDGTKTLECSTTEKGSEWQWAESDVDGYKKFHVAITGLTANQYTTELTAQAYVDGTKSTEIVTRSIATVANAALAANTLEDKLSSAKITALEGYVTDTAVALPFDVTGVSVADGSITWTAVDNAKGYLVQMGDEIQNVPATEAETYSVSLGDYTGAVKMLPYGDGDEYRYAQTTYCYTPKTLADFNDASYIETIGVVSGNHYAGAFVNNNLPTFSTTNCPSGAVNPVLYWDDYHDTAVNETDLAAFTITLPNALNLESGYDGIEIKLYMLGVKAYNGNRPKVRLEMFYGEASGTWNDTQSTVSTDWYGDGVTLPAQAMTLQVTMAQLKALGYQTGDKVLTLGIRSGVKITNNNNAAYFVNFQIDDISYYGTAIFETPTTTPEIPTPTPETTVSKTLADFNDASYIETIGVVSGNHYAGAFVNNNLPTFSTTNCPSGAVNPVLYWDDYHDTAVNETDLAAFTITLPNALNLESGYDGIEIKLYMLGVKAYNGNRPKVRLEMFYGEASGTWNDTQSTVSTDWYGDGVTLPAQAMTLQVTMAQLKALGYQTGDKVLTLGIRSGVKITNNNNAAYFVNFQIDDISYYGEDKAEGAT